MFQLGRQSRQNLAGVNTKVIQVVIYAIENSAVDFGVGEGVRGDAEQLRDWQRKASKLNGIPIGKTVNGIRGTGRGNHQLNLTDGTGHAVDLVPYVDGVILWSLGLSDTEQWDHIYPMAEAMRAAAVELNIGMRWGAVWDRRLNDLPAGAGQLKTEVATYAVRHKGPDFLDGVHFELRA